MADFDPKAYLASSEEPSFDPKAYLADKSEAAPAENPHDLVPFLKSAWQGVKNTADEFSSKPLPTIAYDHLVKPAVDTYSDARAQGANVVNASLDAAANATGNVADLGKAFVAPETTPVEAYFRSRSSGNTAEDALKDARNVSLLLAAPKVAGAVAGPVADAAGWAGKKAAHAFTGVTPATIDRYLANPEAVNAAQDLTGVTKKFVASVDQNADKLSKDSSASFATLKDSGETASPETFTQPLYDAVRHINSLGPYGPERGSAMKYLSTLASDVSQDAKAKVSDGVLTLDKGKTLLNVLDGKIQDLDANPEADPQILKAFSDARSGIDDYLKKTVPAYGDQMTKLADETTNLKGVADKFRTPQGAMNTLKRVQNGRDPFTTQDLANYDQKFGTTFGDDLKNSYAQSNFDKDSTAGSKKTTPLAIVGHSLGTMAGGPVGGVIGAGAGWVAGTLADKYGGQVVKSMLDAGIKVGKLANTPYADTLAQAAQRGPQALAVQHYLLSQKDPAYQATQKDDDHGND